MSQTLRNVLFLIEQEDIQISAHGYDELVADSILISDVMAGVADAVVVEDYPKYRKGPAVLVLQRDLQGNPIHILWGIPKGKSSPAVLVTSYRPDPNRWSDDFLGRNI